MIRKYPTGGSGKRNSFMVTSLSQLAGVSFLTAVNSFWDVTLNAALPLAPVKGDRYIAVNTGLGWTDQNIYEWSGTAWTEYAPKDGDVVTCSYMSKQFIYSTQYYLWTNYPFSWHWPVFDFYDNTASVPATGTRGERYIALITANGWYAKIIYEWDGTQWHYNPVVEGSVVWVKQKGSLYYYDETATWVQLPDAWEEPVISIYDNTAGVPAGAVGDRYIAKVTAHGWTQNRIYEGQQGGTWAEFIPIAGTILWVNAASLPYTYNGSAWNPLTPLTAHPIAGALHTASTVTDLKTKISGPDFLITSQAGELALLTAKGTPIGADTLVIEDSADSDKKKKIAISTLPAAAPAAHASTHIQGGSDSFILYGTGSPPSPVGLIDGTLFIKYTP